MTDLIYYWIDIIWLPIAFFAVHKRHRWWAAGFVIATMILIRLLAEMLVHTGFSHGIMGLMSYHVHTRGVVTSSIFYTLFLLMAHYSSKTEGIVFMAAGLSFIFMIFATTTIIMLL